MSVSKSVAELGSQLGFDLAHVRDKMTHVEKRNQNQCYLFVLDSRDSVEEGFKVTTLFLAVPKMSKNYVMKMMVVKVVIGQWYVGIALDSHK